MERQGGLTARAEGLLRLLAAAGSAARLYPPTSPLRLEAITRFTREANAVTEAYGTIQYRVDRSRFVVAETAIGEDIAPVAALAESFHALQVGQFIVAPGVTESEVSRLLDIIGGEARAVRASGGIRAALVEAGVTSIAVVEVSLRASTESGLLGLDLTGAPLEDIAVELTRSASTWAQEALGGGEGTDMVAEAIGRLETAARDLAMRRCAEALLHLDESTRQDILTAALTTDAGGARMDGLLNVVAHMQPSALARLLKLTAGMLGREPDALLAGIEIPPALAAELSALLRPSPRTEGDCGVPARVDVDAITADVAESDDEDLGHIDDLVKRANPRESAARGLATVVNIASGRPTEESVRAITEALPAAVAAGAFDEVADAARLLAGLADEPALAASVQTARQSLASPAILDECVRRLAEDPSLDGARAVLEAAGAPGAEALVSAYIQGDLHRRAALLPVVASLAETVAPVAGRTLRSGDAATATAIIEMLGATGVRRLLPTIASALEHLDSRVREAAVVAIGHTEGPDASQILQKTLAHWDPETRRLAAREIGRARMTEALPALLKVIGVIEIFERNYELKKEVLKSLEALHSAEAVPVLERLSNRPIVLGKKNRELRYLARRVLESLKTEGRAD
ncbi:MAG TPA: HEAT repeat domain-containing protein [Coriobacteriia bacterium]|nr:HEAT repeat domain-containing protein [Coriobacteriia bacterium]